MKSFTKFLKSGYTTLVAVVLAIIVGIRFPEIGAFFKPFSSIFLTLISISVIPIIFSSVTISIVKLVSEKNSELKIFRIIYMFVGALVLSAIIGIIFGIIFDPGQDVANSKMISNNIFKDIQKSISVFSLQDEISKLQKFSFIDFLTTLVPKNPFEAFAKGNVLQIFAVSILIGMSIAILDKKKRDTSVNALNVLMEAFKMILRIPTDILPIGVFFILSSSLSEMDMDVMLSMKNFCISAVLAFAAIVLIAFIIILIYSPVGLKKSIIALKEPVIVAFSTCSNQATLPFLTSVLIEKFGLPVNAVNLSIPLGITMCRTANVAYYSFMAIFIASLYNQPLTLIQYAFIVFGAILASLAASGASGVLAVTMISIILDPLNLSIGSLAILIIVDPIIEPLRTTTSLIMNTAVSCTIVNTKKRKNKKLVTV